MKKIPTELSGRITVSSRKGRKGESCNTKTKEIQIAKYRVLIVLATAHRPCSVTCTGHVCTCLVPLDIS